MRGYGARFHVDDCYAMVSHQGQETFGECGRFDGESRPGGRFDDGRSQSVVGEAAYEQPTPIGEAPSQSRSVADDATYVEPPRQGFLANHMQTFRARVLGGVQKPEFQRISRRIRAVNVNEQPKSDDVRISATAFQFKLGPVAGEDPRISHRLSQSGTGED